MTLWKALHSLWDMKGLCPTHGTAVILRRWTANDYIQTLMQAKDYGMTTLAPKIQWSRTSKTGKTWPWDWAEVGLSRDHRGVLKMTGLERSWVKRRKEVLGPWHKEGCCTQVSSVLHLVRWKVLGTEEACPVDAGQRSCPAAVWRGNLEAVSSGHLHLCKCYFH